MRKAFSASLPGLLYGLLKKQNALFGTMVSNDYFRVFLMPISKPQAGPV
ncbi:hypothetical protein [Falsiporphyromonas endometrii]|uniref:Uncharacterized protein n=1 Tax=Falsiporphyromonas endometrii TaxID=1387297 RepID=A0ABV9K7J2_9PORP